MRTKNKALIFLSIIVFLFVLLVYLLSPVVVSEGKMIGRVVSIKENIFPKESWKLKLFVKNEVFTLRINNQKVANGIKNYDGKYVEIFYRKRLIGGLFLAELSVSNWQPSNRVDIFKFHH